MRNPQRRWPSELSKQVALFELEKTPHRPVLVRGDNQVDYLKDVPAMVFLQHAGAQSVGLVSRYRWNGSPMKPLAPDYKRAIHWALGLHLGIVVMMFLEIDFPWQNEKPSITYAVQNAENPIPVSQASLDAQQKLQQEKQRQIEAARLAELEIRQKLLA